MEYNLSLLFEERFQETQEDDLTDSIRSFYNSDWEMIEKKPWIQFDFIGNSLPVQGWKCHVSTTRDNAIITVCSVVPVLMNEKCNFKIVATFAGVDIINDAHYPISGAGKFITVYPQNEIHFVRVMHKLKEKLDGICGPHIFTDRQCGLNSVLHYRYGAFKNIQSVDRVTGEVKQWMYSVDGMLIEDKRLPWYQVPKGITDPFENDKDFIPSSMLLSDTPLARYQFTYILQRANKGNVYLALDRVTGNKAIVKEARPYIFENGISCVDLLNNEYQALERLRCTEIVPKVFDIFEVCGVSYLVEEYISGTPLRSVVANKNMSYEQKKHILCTIQNSSEKMHQMGIVHNDLSPNNIFLTGEDKVVFIDFENAIFTGSKITRPVSRTIGFFDPDHVWDDKYTAYDDDYAVMLSFISLLIGRRCPVVNDSPRVVKREDYSAKMMKYLYFVRQNSLLQNEEYKCFYTRFGSGMHEKSYIHSRDDLINSFFDGVKNHFNAQIEKNSDRLFQTGSFGRITDSLCMQHGSSGIGEVLLELTKVAEINVDAISILKIVADYTIKHYFSSNRNVMDNSLLFGRCGSLWFLFDYALYLKDEKLLNKVLDEICSLNFQSEETDFALGSAGYGCLLLKVWKATGHQGILEKVNGIIDQAKELIKEKSDDNYVWEYSDFGFAHGVLGPVYFLANAGILIRDNLLVDTAFQFINTIYLNLLMKQLERNDSLAKDISWCKGIGGIGIAIIQLKRIVKDLQIESIIEKLSDHMVKNMWNQSNCVCHGKMK